MTTPHFSLDFPELVRYPITATPHEDDDLLCEEKLEDMVKPDPIAHRLPSTLDMIDYESYPALRHTYWHLEHAYGQRFQDAQNRLGQIAQRYAPGYLRQTVQNHRTRMYADMQRQQHLVESLKWQLLQMYEELLSERQLRRQASTHIDQLTRALLSRPPPPTPNPSPPVPDSIG